MFQFGRVFCYSAWIQQHHRKKKPDPNGWEPDIFGGTVRGRALKDALPEKALVSRSPRGVQPLPEAGREEVWKLLKRLVIFGWNLDGAQTVDIN